MRLPEPRDVTARLDYNYERFQALVTQANSCLVDGRSDFAAVHAELAAFHATWRHNGLFASDQLEQILITIAERELPTSPSRPHSDGPIRRVLHIASMVHGLAGLQHLLVRWIRADSRRRHDVAVSQPAIGPTPKQLMDAVDVTGGQIEHVGDDHTTRTLDRARRLRKLGMEADLVVLHLQTEDVAPIIALAHDPNRPSVLIVNHADHCFWLGGSIVDLVVNLRSSGHELCVERRGIVRERLATLPTPIDLPNKSVSRQDARRILGFPAEGKLLLSVARDTKYDPRGGQHFVDLHLPILNVHEDAYLWVVGPEHGPTWQRANVSTGGRVRALGPRRDTELFYAAADIYVDAYPMVSLTSLLEAGSWGLPLFSLSAYGSDAAVWCADAPGLGKTITLCRDGETYVTYVGQLISDAKQRSEVGRVTRLSILQNHTGRQWLRTLEAAYARAGELASDRDDRGISPTVQRKATELDVLVTKLLTAHDVVDAFWQFRKRLPASRLFAALLQGWPDEHRRIAALHARFAVGRLLDQLGVGQYCRAARHAVRQRWAA